MLVKPPISQAPVDVKTAPYNSPLQAVSDKKENEIMLSAPNKINIVDNKVVHKKKEYKAFIRLIKKGKFTNAIISAKLLGVSRQTISLWLKKKEVQECMNQDINMYVSKIQSNRDWKAQAYLLDKIAPNDKENDNKSAELTNMIQINITGTDKK